MFSMVWNIETVKCRCYDGFVQWTVDFDGPVA